MPASLFLAIGATAAWGWAVAAIGLRGRGRRGRRGGTGLGPTPPAVLLLLESPGRHDDPRVLNAAVLELADRGVVEIIPADSQGPAMIRPAAVPDGRLLPEYLDVVLARLAHRSGPRRGPIPLTAMRADEDRRALVWLRDFDKAVRREAVARGLMQPRVRAAAQWPLLLSSLVPSLLIDLTLAHYWKQQTFIPFLTFLLAELLAISAATSASRVRVTAAGRAELGRARAATQAGALAAPARPGWTEQAAHLPRAAEHLVLPTQLSPLPANQIWSDYGGSWHPLDLESREVYRDSGARSPFLGVTGVAAFCAGSQFYQAATRHLSPLSAAVFLGLPAAVLAVLAVRAARRRKLPKYLVLRGKVARLWSVQDADGRANKTAGRHPAQHYCVLDVGRGPRSVRLHLAPRRYRTLRVGDIVEVAVRPRRGRISALRNLGEDFS
jgi:hypothetical protein